ncbi:MAG: tetraacyldisaccharide 4'-kinase [Chlorobi bacterium]|nr:tetraacyldisaccharide 4'-kinase [Chlorobiota bacterium]
MAFQVSSVLKVVLFPVSVLYGLVAGIRNRLYDMQILRSQDCDVPVIVVGNITAGGTGKTPHVEYLVDLLRPSCNVAVLSRGYKRKTRGFIKARTTTPWSEIGDEPFQIRQKFRDIDVAVDEKRKRGIRLLVEENAEKRVIILDDGFQHRSVKPGLSILLIDYNHPLSGDYYLPAGRLRESCYEFRRANIILFTKCPEKLKPIDERIRVKKLNPYPYQQVFFTKIQYNPPVSLFSDEEPPKDIKTFLKQFSSVLVVTGIANPDTLVVYLQQYVKKVNRMHFPDHYLFKPADIEKICKNFAQISGDDKIVLTTEKDAVRLRSIRKESFQQPEKWYFVPVSIRFLQESEQQEFNKILLSYVEKDKGNHWLSSKQG